MINISVSRLRSMTARRLRAQTEVIVVHCRRQPVAALIPHAHYLKLQAVAQRIKERFMEEGL